MVGEPIPMVSCARTGLLRQDLTGRCVSPVSCEEEAALQAEAENGGLGLEMAGETQGKWWIVLGKMVVLSG